MRGEERRVWEWERGDCVTMERVKREEGRNRSGMWICR